MYKKEKHMTIRENLEQREKSYLSPYATLSINSKGRDREEPPCDIRPIFQRDRDRILHSKSFRRLKDKTQVFLSPEGDHYRTRLTHTLEVSQNARTIARALQLNEELVEAIALGHDLGHTPFGHAGERALNEICPYGFKHNEQSVRTVEILEKDGEGLNLTWEVRDGILNHQTSSMPSTLEGKIVRFSDKIAYTYHDMDDAVRAGILKERDVPREIGEIVGYSPRERLNNFIHDIVTQSLGTDDVKMSDDVELAMKDLRHFMFDHVYNNPIAKTLYEHYMDHTDELPKFFVELGLRGEPREKVVCDYISSMTDRFAINLYDELYVPKFWMG
jgi:dGTPase